MFADAINDRNRANDAIQRKQDLAASRVARNDALSRLLRELPNEFTIDDMKMLTAEKGMASSTAYVYVKRMIDRELIMDDGEKYRKLDAEEM
jgi:GTPase Era involved in 16S rRNA processing